MVWNLKLKKKNCEIINSSEKGGLISVMEIKYYFWNSFFYLFEIPLNIPDKWASLWS